MCLPLLSTAIRVEVIALSQKLPETLNWVVEALAKIEVEEAKMPIRAQSAVEVAEVVVPKFDNTENGKEPPQLTPEAVRVFVVFQMAHCPAVPVPSVNVPVSLGNVNVLLEEVMPEKSRMPFVLLEECV